MIYIGVDACKAGWFAFMLGEESAWHSDIFADISSLWNKYRGINLILIDIPIGLPQGDSNERTCDKTARKLLGRKRGSSVFPVPCRAAIYADVKEASQINERITGKKLSKQVLAIIPKIRQVDQLLTYDMGARSRIREIHPEICFRALNGGREMKFSKKRRDGFQERMKVLANVFPSAKYIVDCTLRKYRRKELAKDDILDALVAVVTASRERQGLLSIPETAEVDSKGLPMEMVYTPLAI